MKTDIRSLANIEFQLEWKSDFGAHCERFFVRRMNLWRDILPKPLLDQILNRGVGDSIEITFNAGDIIPDHDPKKLFRIKQSQFDNIFRSGTLIYPRKGRFYPKGLLRGVPNVFRVNMEPFRCAMVDDSEILVDFNHPLAGVTLNVTATVKGIEEKPPEQGGGISHDWMEAVTTGPGMQARWNGQPSEFLSDSPFLRRDETPDRNFYEKPRLVDHIDSAAGEIISGLYGGILRNGSHVLDLMSSWKSHIPAPVRVASLTGLGMNAEEMRQNDRLNDFVVQDLNVNPVMPFRDAFFDVVICTVSVEYLTNPVAVFREVGRVLKPGGCFMTTFSNRWFPPKVTAIWEELLEFERMGLVSEYFLLSDSFENVRTYSNRGLPRPPRDKYYNQLPVSDPIYAVWAYRS